MNVLDGKRSLAKVNKRCSVHLPPKPPKKNVAATVGKRSPSLSVAPTTAFASINSSNSSPRSNLSVSSVITPPSNPLVSLLQRNKNGAAITITTTGSIMPGATSKVTSTLASTAVTSVATPISISLASLKAATVPTATDPVMHGESIECQNMNYIIPDDIPVSKEEMIVPEQLPMSASSVKREEMSVSKFQIKTEEISLSESSVKEEEIPPLLESTVIKEETCVSESSFEEEEEGEEIPALLESTVVKEEMSVSESSVNKEETSVSGSSVIKEEISVSESSVKEEEIPPPLESTVIKEEMSFSESSNEGSDVPQPISAIHSPTPPPPVVLVKTLQSSSSSLLILPKTNFTVSSMQSINVLKPDQIGSTFQSVPQNYIPNIPQSLQNFSNANTNAINPHQQSYLIFDKPVLNSTSCTVTSAVTGPEGNNQIIADLQSTKNTTGMPLRNVSVRSPEKINVEGIPLPLITTSTALQNPSIVSGCISQNTSGENACIVSSNKGSISKSQINRPECLLYNVSAIKREIEEQSMVGEAIPFYKKSSFSPKTEDFRDDFVGENSEDVSSSSEYNLVSETDIMMAIPDKHVSIDANTNEEITYQIL